MARDGRGSTPVVAVCLALCACMGLTALAVAPSGPTHFDGQPVSRVVIRLRGAIEDCSDAAVSSVADISPRRTPHTWRVVDTADAAALAGRGESVETVDTARFAEIGGLAASATAPAVEQHLTRLVTFTDGRKTYATAFADPRVLRLHAGHHNDVTPTGADHTMWSRVIAGLRGDTSAAPSAKDQALELVDGTEALWIPSWVRKLHLHCGNGSMPDAVLPVPAASGRTQKRGFGAKSAANVDPSGEVEVRTLYSAGPPTKTYNIIFLAGGFREQDREMFFWNASNISAMMADVSLDPKGAAEDTAISDMHKTVPFDRYWANWNVYAVFQPSLDAGANRPLYGISVRNNLGCTHPETMERAVFCDRELSIALAAASPGDVLGDPNRNIIVNVVNTHLYGGSAISIPNRLHLGNFFNGFDLSNIDNKRRMLSLVNHELGHAFGDLMDEYSIGVAEPQDRQLSNCEYNAGGAPKWNHWLTAKRAAATPLRERYAPLVSNEGWDVLDTPEPVCGFTNYYKANANCMMHRLKDYFMCPVCREAATKAIFNVRFDLEWPRKPLRDIVTVVAPSEAAFNGTATTAPSDNILTVDGEVVLHLSAHLTRGFTVTAVDPVGAPLPLLHTTECYNCIMLNASHFATYPRDTILKVNITIADDTDNFILDAGLKTRFASQLTQTTFFRLLLPSTMARLNQLTQDKNMTLVAGNRDAVVGRHLSDLQSAYQYCEADDPTLNETLVCSMDFPNKTYERPLDVGGILANYDMWVLVGLGCLALLFLLLWAYAATACTDKANQTARTIFKTKHSCLITLIRRVMMFSAVAFLIASVVAIAVSAYYYYKANTLGRIMLAGGVALSILLYFLAFFGFWAVMSRSKRMLVINGVLLFIALGVLTVIFIVVVEIGQELQVESSFTIDMGDVSVQNQLGGGGGGGGGSGGGNGTVGSNTPGTAGAAAQNGFWTNQLESLWIDVVTDDPETACAIQGMLECSGFYTNCASEYASSLTCPANCEETNRKFLSPCQSILKGYIVDNYIYIASATGSSAGLLGGGMMLNWILLVLLCLQKKDIRKANTQRIQQQRKARADRRGKGAAAAGAAAAAAGAAVDDDLPKGLQKVEEDQLHALFLLRSLDSSSTASLVREFKRIDIDGNGELSRAELFVFFKKVLMYKPSVAEIDALMSVADLDGDGTISLVEFLKLFGCKDTEEAKALVNTIANPRRAPRVPVITVPGIRRKSVDANGAQRRRKSEQLENVALLDVPTSSPQAGARAAPAAAAAQGTYTPPDTATQAASVSPSSPSLPHQQQQQYHQQHHHQQQQQPPAKAFDPLADYDDIL